ncbi:hypothetical protein E2C01_032162 [Portunus trituberculatus]|uniref:Uncharacterized protein n=1 Tax=Portunus trituberculatus TaxID=210409 RepID=A0A5B7EUN3_PORTR|nr:hypothetical protein [Portunus trituberculatus]
MHFSFIGEGCISTARKELLCGGWVMHDDRAQIDGLPTTSSAGTIVMFTTRCWSVIRLSRPLNPPFLPLQARGAPPPRGTPWTPPRFCR